MDRPGNSRTVLAGALRDIARVNSYLGGSRTLLRAALVRLNGSGGARTVLDVGTGLADLPRNLVTHARARGQEVRVVAVERDPVTASLAREACRGFPEIRVLRADAFRLPFDDGAFDLVLASMFLHHFKHGSVVRHLRRFRAIARDAVIVNDLRRHRLPWLFISLASRIVSRNPMTRHDGPLSVLRGFTAEELRAAARDAGDRSPCVRRCWPYRLLAVLPSANGSRR